MKVLRNIITGTGTIGELLQFLWLQKAWWLIPVVLLLLLVGTLLIASQSTGVAPFIYTLF